MSCVSALAKSSIPALVVGNGQAMRALTACVALSSPETREQNRHKPCHNRFESHHLKAVRKAELRERLRKVARVQERRAVVFSPTVKSCAWQHPTSLRCSHRCLRERAHVRAAAAVNNRPGTHSLLPSRSMMGPTSWSP